MKRSYALWLSDKHTFKLIAGAHVLTTEHSILSVMATLILEMIFMLFSAYNAVQ